MKTSGVRRVWLGLALVLATPVSDAADSKLKNPADGPAVAVFVKKDNLLVADLRSAEQVTARLFAGIGVRLVFRGGAAPASGAEGALLIELQLDAKAPSNLRAGTLAYATPFGKSGTRIRIFCDRVSQAWPGGGTGVVLGHVMAHEIAHVLERVNHHSAEGVMKASWQERDYRQMKAGTLAFDPTDAELIHDALEKMLPQSAGSHPAPR